MLLIINADDFGYTAGVNRGIVKAMDCGVVTGTSLMVNQSGTEDALDILRSGGVSAAGVHLCLTAGMPASDPAKIPSLVDRQGRFKERQALMSEPLDGDEVRREFFAQVEKARAAGVQVTHLDTHHHIHAHPVVLESLLTVAKTYRLPVRSIDPSMRALLTRQGVVTPDYFCDEWFAEAVSKASFKHFITAGLCCGVRVMELMTHPGVVDDELKRRSSYTFGREKELAILCDPAIGQWLGKLGVRLGGYLDL